MNEKLLPGTPLREDRIAEEFHVSATPVREAFRCLEFEGWLQSIPFRGCFLREFSRDELCEHYQLREMLEGLAAASAARNATSEDISALRQALEEGKQFYQENSRQQGEDLHPSFQPDLHFHQTIAEISRNKLLQQRLKMINAQIVNTSMLCHVQATTFEDDHRVFQEHEMILSAIERGWEEAAEVLMRQHISEAKKLFLETWDRIKAEEKTVKKRGRKPRKTPALTGDLP